MFDNNIISHIGEHLRNNKQTLAVAESVTSGFVQAALSQAEFASEFFQGGITAYNLGQKYKHLEVEPIAAQECECVSEKVASEMAASVCRMFKSDYGCAITGFATKVPEKGINELYAFLSIAYRSQVKAVHRVRFSEEGMKAQLYYCNQLLEFLKNNLVNEK